MHDALKELCQLKKITLKELAETLEVTEDELRSVKFYVTYPVEHYTEDDKKASNLDTKVRYNLAHKFNLMVGRNGTLTNTTIDHKGGSMPEGVYRIESTADFRDAVRKEFLRGNNLD